MMPTATRVTWFLYVCYDAGGTGHRWHLKSRVMSWWRKGAPKVGRGQWARWRWETCAEGQSEGHTGGRRGQACLWAGVQSTEEVRGSALKPWGSGPWFPSLQDRSQKQGAWAPYRVCRRQHWRQDPSQQGGLWDPKPRARQNWSVGSARRGLPFSCLPHLYLDARTVADMNVLLENICWMNKWKKNTAKPKPRHPDWATTGGAGRSGLGRCAGAL